MRGWITSGLVCAGVLEIVLFVFTYMINRNIQNTPGLVSGFPFPPAFSFILIIFVIGFGVGALIGKLFFDS